MFASAAINPHRGHDRHSTPHACVWHASAGGAATPLALRISDAPVLPAAAAETYTAHSTALPAVQFNTVYLTPCTTVPSFNFGAASDKRSSL